MQSYKTNHINKENAFPELEKGVLAALETYSNVHRGSGHFSMVSTHLYEQAREIVLDYLKLDKSSYVVIFSSPASSASLLNQMPDGSFRILRSSEIGLPIGIHALAVKRNALPQGIPLFSGGGTTRLISTSWVLWAGSPDKFEAGTPSILNIICFARALKMIGVSEAGLFNEHREETLLAKEIIYHDALESYSGKELLDCLKQTISGKGILVPTMEGSSPLINLDNSASTPAFGPVWKAYCQTLKQPVEVRRQLCTEGKAICADFLGATAEKYDIIFTSNTTEAINLAAESFGMEQEEGIEHVVLNTIMEHSSNDLPWRFTRGISLLRLSVNDEGLIDHEALENILRDYNALEKYGKKRVRLIAICGASNVLGICNDLAVISSIAHKHGARLLVDAAQLVAHRKIRMEEWGIDYLAFSAHKVYAPFGSGALVVRKGLLMQDAEKLRCWQDSGEENAAGIAALGKALILLQRVGMELVHKEEKILTAKALSGLAKVPGLQIFGVQDFNSAGFENKIGVIVFRLKRMMPSQLVKELAIRSGIGARYGCHCAHIIIKHLLKVSPSLERFQKIMLTLIPSVRLPGLARISLGLENTEEDIDSLIQVLEEIATKPIARQARDHGKPSKSEQKRQMDEFTRNASKKVYSE
ncbi:MAG: aminotransferase class V-fold PLP-dependent enzyme [Bacteroidetes bacterium]|nr:aminotransferase class V-fold PLP-dependent enzyme [Bacteroidota bacterium]